MPSVLQTPVLVQYKKQIKHILESMYLHPPIQQGVSTHTLVLHTVCKNTITVQP